MPKKINISGEIGWDYSVSMLADSLREAKGEDIEIDVASPGGSVFDGIEMYNAIRDYKRNNPKAQILMTLKGLGASMASYIMMAPADLRAAEDNAVFMIHNPWSLAVGDYREMEKQSEFLAGLADLMADAYVKVTGKTKKEIKEMMDAETWVFGKDIKTMGFVSEIIATDDKDKDDKDKKKALASAVLSFGEMKRNAQKRADAENESKKVAAMLSALPGNTGSDNHITNPKAGEGVEEVEIKCIADVQANYPAVYAEAVNAIGDAAVEKERARVKALSDARAKWGKVGAVAELIDSAIADGKEYSEIAGNVADLALAAADSVGSINAHGNVDSQNDYVPISIIKEAK